MRRPATLLAAITVLGCAPSRDSAPAPRATVGLHVGEAAPVARLDTTSLATVGGAPRPQLTDVRAGCDSAAALMRAALGLKPTRTDGPFKDTWTQSTRIGCTIIADGTFKALNNRGSPVDVLLDSFTSHGWRGSGHEADGPDGSVVGVRSRDILCVIRGEWDGGDDSEPDTATAKADVDQSYRATIECSRDVVVNDSTTGVPDAIWSIARRAGLDSIYAIAHNSFNDIGGDFDGDKVRDAAVFVENRVSGKLGVAIIRRGAGQVVVLGAGTGSPGPDDLDGMGEVEVYYPGTIHLSINDKPSAPLVGDALWISLPNKKSVFYLWTGSAFTAEVHSR